MGIFDRMQKITRGETDNTNNVELQEDGKLKVGQTLKGIITNIMHSDESKGRKGGFGFISSPELPYERIFFHWSALRQDTLRFPQLEKKMRVEFILQYSEPSERHEGGYRAIKIKVLD